MSATAIYLYAITRPVDPDALTGLRGIGGASVRSVRDGDLACLVSSVSLDEFGEDALRDNLENLGWLERTARAHDAVVQAAAERVTTAPLRLGTICLNDDAVIARLSEVRERASEVLDRLDGRIEWGVKVFGPEAAAPVPVASAVSGTEYLQRRRTETIHREQAAEAAASVAEAVYQQLAELAVAGRRHRPQDPRLSGADGEMLLNAAFLVEVSRSLEFEAAVDQLSAKYGAERVVLTGPWPPYSFASLDPA